MNGSTRCMLFDLDGTLIDTFRLYMESFRHTLEPHFKRRLSDAEILALNPHAEQRLLLEIIQEADFTPYFERFLTYYSALHDALFGGPYEGVLEMLGALQAQGYLLGIVTGKSREAWRVTATRLEDHGFEDLFDVVLTDDDVQNPKPSPEGLLVALDVLDLQPSQALYIGDSKRDHQAAEAAGLPFGIAFWPRAKDGRATFGDPASETDVALSFASPAAVVTWAGQNGPRASRISGVR